MKDGSEKGVVRPHELALDKEWIKLLAEAKETGISIKEIQEFLDKIQVK